MLTLSASDVERLIQLDELRSALEVALRELSAGRVIQPVRKSIRVPEHDGVIGLMPAVYGSVMGAKLVTVYPGNARRGLHTHNAVIALFRSDTGEPLAMMDGRVITTLRTAAVSALATRELSDTQARVLGILGSGVQARSHFDALRRVRNFDEVRVWSRAPEHAREFARETGSTVSSLEEMVRDADVVVTVTASHEPMVRSEWLKDGALVNAVGSVGPLLHELHNQVLREAGVVVESREAALRESAEITESGAEIYAELGEILGGSKPKPENRITVFKSLGVAVEDVAAAKLVYENATGGSATM